MGPLERLQEHWLGSAVVLVVVTAGVTWAAAHWLRVEPREYSLLEQKERLRSFNEQLDECRSQVSELTNQCVASEVFEAVQANLEETREELGGLKAASVPRGQYEDVRRLAAQAATIQSALADREATVRELSRENAELSAHNAELLQRIAGLRSASQIEGQNELVLSILEILEDHREDLEGDILSLSRDLEDQESEARSWREECNVCTEKRRCGTDRTAEVCSIAGEEEGRAQELQRLLEWQKERFNNTTAEITLLQEQLQLRPVVPQ